MTKHLTALLLVLTLSLCGTAALSESSAPAKKAEALPTIKYEKYKLKNGLEVILSQDHRLPLVAVDLWYHSVRRMSARDVPALRTFSNT